MFRDFINLPPGRSLDSGSWVEKRFSTKPLNGFACFLRLSSNYSTVHFWKQILEYIGAKAYVLKNSEELSKEIHLILLI